MPHARKLNTLDPFERKEGAPKIVLIPTHRLIASRHQARTSFDEEKLIMLADSIRRHGVLTPLLVKAEPVRMVSRDGRMRITKYELIAGERRLRAAKLIDLEYLPCILIHTESRAAEAELSLIENMQREDLDLFESADGVRNLVKMDSVTREDAAEQLSLPERDINTSLRISRLTDSEKSFIREKELNKEQAYIFAGIKDEKVRSLAMKSAAESVLTEEKTRECIENITNALNGDKDSSPQKESAEIKKNIERAAKREKESREKKRPFKRMMVFDMRIFTNTIERAVEIIKCAGFSAEVTKKEEDNGLCYSIRVLRTPS